MATTNTPVFVDCDNTMGLPRQEIDDGLTLLYLLGRPDIDLVGVSATHGNGSAAQAYEQTVSLFNRLGLEVPVYPAGEPAASALSAASSKHPGLTVLGLGALTNLSLAAERDSGFYQRLGSIVLMGGYTKPLRFLRREVHELNFSSDPEAAHSVLYAPCPVTVMSAQYCLSARFGFADLLSSRHPRWLHRLIREWFLAFSWGVGSAGFFLWDLIPAAWVGQRAWDGFLRPAPRSFLSSTVEDLTTGTLRVETVGGLNPAESGVIGLPDHQFSRRAFARHCTEYWGIGAGTTI